MISSATLARGRTRTFLASDGFSFSWWPSMKTPIRVLTIEDFNPDGRHGRISCASLLRLKGCWLKEAGFHAGDQVMVTNPSPGVIELRVRTPIPIDVTYAKAIKQLDAVLNEQPELPQITGPIS